MLHPVNAFCFANLFTVRPEASARFYGNLLGWTVTSASEELSLFQLGGRTVAGMRVSEESTPRWVPYVHVSSVDETARRARSLGAVILSGPADLLGAARSCVLQDPEGAVLGFWEPHGLDGTELESGSGSLWWIELLARDIASARRFYTSLFDWTIAETDKYETGQGPYTLFKVGDRSACGALQFHPSWGVTPRWQVYFEVTSHEQAASLTCSMGGTSGFWRDVPTAGRIGDLCDPLGAEFVVAQPLTATE